MKSNLDELEGGGALKARLTAAGFVLNSAQEGRHDLWLLETAYGKVRVIIGLGPTYMKGAQTPGFAWFDVRFISHLGNIVGFCTDPIHVSDAVAVLDREIREHFSPLFTLLTPPLTGEDRSLQSPSAVDRGGVSLAFIRGWVGAAQANAAAIANPAQRLAYLEAQFAQLKARLEE